MFVGERLLQNEQDVAMCKNKNRHSVQTRMHFQGVWEEKTKLHVSPSSPSSSSVMVTVWL